MNNDCTAKVSLHHLHISLQKVGRLYFLNLGVKGLTRACMTKTASDTLGLVELPVRPVDFISHNCPMDISLLKHFHGSTLTTDWTLGQFKIASGK